MKTNTLKLGLAALAVAAFVGCGDDDIGSNGPSSADQVVASFEDLTQCTARREGATAYVKDEKTEYVCDGENWVPTDDAEPGTTKTGSSRNGSSAEGSSDSGNASQDGFSDSGNSQGASDDDCSSEKGTTSSSRPEGYVPHKPDILQWGSNYATVTVNDTIAFTLAYLIDANGVDDIKRYDWDFGDGTKLRKTDSSSVKHAYASAGSYTISITVTDSNGDSATKSLIVTVIAGTPVVDAGTKHVCYNMTPCSFQGTAIDSNIGSQAGNGTVALYEWDYDGDGMFDEQKTTNSFNHAYPDTSASARYTAKFCATDDDGNRACDTTTVDVSNKAPTLSGHIRIASRSAGANVTFSPAGLLCTDPENNQLDSLWWDLNGDSVFETAKGKMENVTTNLPLNGPVNVRCKDKWSAASNSISDLGNVVFDHALGYPGTGRMVADGSWFLDPQSAIVEAQHADGNWYPVSQSLDIATCPTHDGFQTGISDCYYGWNDADMLTDSSFKVGVKLMKYVGESGWGITNGGFVYILSGRDFWSAKSVSVNGSVTVTIKAAAGKPVKLYAWDQPEYIDCEGVPKYGFIGTGDWQTVEALVSDFKPYAGASNSFTGNAIGLGLEYEYAATAKGQACTLCSDTPLDLEWRTLCFGGCGY